MASNVILDTLVGFGDAADAALAKVVRAVMQANDWTVTGAATLKMGPTGYKLHVNAPAPTIFPGVATSTITARSGSTAGSGTFKTRALAGSTLSDAVTGLAISSNLATAVASGTALMVGYDGVVYWLLSADCP